jgi:hypothetical protein
MWNRLVKLDLEADGRIIIKFMSEKLVGKIGN